MLCSPTFLANAGTYLKYQMLETIKILPTINILGRIRFDKITELLGNNVIVCHRESALFAYVSH